MAMQLSETAEELFNPKRYKTLYGGRGGCKSHDIAGALVTKGAEKPLLILCAREIQKSIKQSVHRLIKNKIEQFGLQALYEVQNDKIIGTNGTEFHFTGLKHDPDGLKSYEGTDICWVEEAENVSDRSWEVLIPTIRKEGSEIWTSFNPRFSSSPTWTRFVVNADEDCFVKKVSWRDNPWFPDVLDKERLKLKKQDPVAYAHVWEGEFDERFNGAVYAKLIKEATENGRISTVPHKPGVPVITAWDLGKKHNTCIWFAQKIGLEVRIIDFYENNAEHLSHYAEVVRSKPYEYKMHWIPHDGRHDRLGMDGSIIDQLKGMGLKCKILPSVGFTAGIELTRELIMTAWFDRDKDKDGIHALNNYEYEYDENLKRFKDKPRDDWAADASDALRYMAIAVNNDEEEVEEVIGRPQTFRGSGGWMG